MRRTTAILAAAVLGALPVAGCGSESQPAVCDSLAAAQLSAQHVRETNVAENGLSQLRTNLQQLRDDVQQLIAEAKSQWATQADAIRSALDQVSASVQTAKAAPNATNFSAVRATLTTLDDSVRSLGDAMRDTC